MASVILKDLAAVLHGSHSELFAASDEDDSPFVAPLVGAVYELGRCYRNVSCDLKNEPIRQCPIRDAFVNAIRGELESYVRAVATLDSEIRQPSKSDSIRYLSTWAEERLVNLRWVCSLWDACTELDGGALLSCVASFARHGDARVYVPVCRVLRASSRPMLAAAASWVLLGTLLNGYPFWVRSETLLSSASPIVAEDNSVVPTSLPMELARRVAATGATSHFLRFACGDVAWLRDFASSHGHIFPLNDASHARILTQPDGVPIDSVEACSGLRELEDMVHTVQPAVDARARQQLCVAHQLPAHFRSLRRYALLGQGDFISALAASLDAAGVLDAPAASLIHSNATLAGALDAAIRASNASLDDRSCTDRLELRLVLPSKETGAALGWQCVRMRYAVGPPLASVITPATEDTYGRLFSSLWHVKRADFVLCSMWASHMTAYHALSSLGHAGLTRLLHTCHTVRGDMTHTVNALTAYAQCDVLSPAFEVLESAVAAARDIPALQSAHTAFLTAAMEGNFLDTGGSHVRVRISQLVDSVLHFADLQDDLYRGTAQLAGSTPHDPADRGRRRPFANSRQTLTKEENDTLDAVLAPYTIPLAAAARAYQLHLRELVRSLDIRWQDGGGMHHVLASSLSTRLNFNHTADSG